MPARISAAGSPPAASTAAMAVAPSSGRLLVVDGHEQRVAVGEALVEVPGVEPRPLAHRPHGRRRRRPRSRAGRRRRRRAGAPLGSLLGGTPGPATPAPAVGVGGRSGQVWQRALPYRTVAGNARCQDGTRGHRGAARSARSEIVVVGGRVGGLAAALALEPRRSPGDDPRARPRCRRSTTPRRPSPPTAAAPRRPTRPTASSPASSSSCGDRFPDVLDDARGRRRLHPMPLTRRASASPAPATTTSPCSSSGAPRSSGCSAARGPRRARRRGRRRRRRRRPHRRRPARRGRPRGDRRASRRRLDRSTPTSWSPPPAAGAPLPAWLAAVGVDVAETVHESGLMYLTRWYRLPAGFSLPPDPKLGGDLGFVKYLAIPGDGDTLLGHPRGPRRATPSCAPRSRDPDRFDAACRMLEGPSQFLVDHPRRAARPASCRWVASSTGSAASSTPTAGRVVPRLPRRRRRPHVHEPALRAGLLAGRSCRRVALADAFAAHPDDPVARAARLRGGCRPSRSSRGSISSAVQMGRRPVADIREAGVVDEHESPTAMPHEGHRHRVRRRRQRPDPRPGDPAPDEPARHPGRADGRPRVHGRGRMEVLADPEPFPAPRRSPARPATSCWPSTPRRCATRGGTTMHDLVIRNGRLVDGTGSPARTADVAVDGDRIVDGRQRRRRRPPGDRRRRAGSSRRAGSTSTPTTTARSPGIPRSRRRAGTASPPS